MSESSEDRELTAIASALRELRPTMEAMDRAALMYRAGRASVRGWLWPSATLLSSAAAFVLGITLWIRPASPIVYVAVPFTRNDALSVVPSSSPATNDSESGAWARYIHLQEQVLLHGLDGLPSPVGTTEEPPSSLESLLKSL